MNRMPRDDKWSSLTTVEQKAKASPQKYLAEAFPRGATGRPANLDIVVLKIGVDERLAIANASEGIGLETVSVDAPWTGSKKPSPDRWIVIGRTRGAVWNQMRDIERETSRSKQALSSEKTKPQAPKPFTPKVKANATNATHSTSKYTGNAPASQTKARPAPATPSISTQMAKVPGSRNKISQRRIDLCYSKLRALLGKQPIQTGTMK